ncbi:hypothetical protein [Metabacillus litoralis]|uniref:hypothetical protein n=1 Tax=Metabacillus litoralis TaxID=152268 RepID=UPI000EF60965|nr:hypothetical protein [Metabacillus litoralis]
MIFPNELIEDILEGIKFAEEETLTDYDLNNVDQEDPITTRLATRIQDETNRIISKSKYKGIWRCDAIELSNKGRNSLEKKYGFDMGITLKDKSKRFIKSLIIQNKMEDGDSQNLENQIKMMESLSPKDKGFVGIIDKAGIYLTTGTYLENKKFDLKKLKSYEMVRLTELIGEFLECKVGQRNLDLQRLQFNKQYIRKKGMVLVSFEKIKPPLE